MSSYVNDFNQEEDLGDPSVSQEEELTPELKELALSSAEQQCLEAEKHRYLKHLEQRSALRDRLIANVGSLRVRDYLENQVDRADNPNQALGIVCFENLDPRYIELIANYITKLQLQQADPLWQHLEIKITRSSLAGLYASDKLPDYPYLVPDEQNATYWRNNNTDGKLDLCAVGSGETADTLGNLRQRMISSDSLKEKLFSAQSLEEIIGKQTSLLDSTVLPEKKVQPSELHNLAVLLSQINELFGANLTDLCDYLAEVLLGYGRCSFAQVLGKALSSLHYPSDSSLFGSLEHKSKKQPHWSKAECKNELSRMCKSYPSFLNILKNSKDLDSYALNKLLENLRKLYPDATSEDAKSSNSGSAPDNDDKAAQESKLTTWEYAICKNFLVQQREVLSEQQNKDTTQLRARRNQAFDLLCTLDWSDKTAKLFDDEDEGKSKKKASLYEATKDLFDKHLSKDEPQLSEQDLKTIALVTNKPSVLTPEESNALTEFFNAHRSIFEKDKSISREWEKLIFFRKEFSDNNFLMSLSHALLSAKLAEGSIASAELRLDYTKDQLHKINADTLFYFSCHYGPVLQRLQDSLGPRFSVSINSHEQPKINPVLNYPAYVAQEKSSQGTNKTQDAYTLKFTLFTTQTSEQTPEKKQKEPGRTARRIIWQLNDKTIDCLFHQDLQALHEARESQLGARAVLQQGRFVHNIFTSKGALQDLSLVNLATFSSAEDGLELKSFFSSNPDEAALGSRVYSLLEDLKASFNSNPDEAALGSSAYSLPEDLKASLKSLSPELKEKGAEALARIQTAFESFVQQYAECIQSYYDCNLTLRACSALSCTYTELQYALLDNYVFEHKNIQKLAPLGKMLHELLRLVLQVGIATPAQEAYDTKYLYALATPFHVEVLRSWANKLELVQELCLSIFTDQVQINDLSQYVEALRNDLRFCDAPEIYVADHNKDREVLMATQSIGGYTLYEAQAKLQQDLGFADYSTNKSKRGRKSTATKAYESLESQGLNAYAQNNKLYLEAIINQIQNYLVSSPMPLNQCSLVLAYCNQPDFVSQLCDRLSKEICAADWLKAYLPQRRINLMLLCENVKQAQSLNHMLEVKRQLKANAGSDNFDSGLGISILLDNSDSKYGGVFDYCKRIGYQNIEREKTPNLGHIGILLHAFDSNAEFEFNSDYKALLVTDEVHYQPALINYCDYHKETSRFVVSPELPLSKIMLQHSMYFLCDQDEALSIFKKAKEDITSSLADLRGSLDLTAQAASALSLQETAAGKKIPTPLYEHVLKSSDGESRELIEKIHKYCDVVFYLDELLTVHKLKKLSGQKLEILFHQRLSKPNLKLIVAAKEGNANSVNKHLEDLLDWFQVPQKEGTQTCLKALREDAVGISGRLLLNAQRHESASNELMGLVLSQYIARDFMDQIGEIYAPEAAQKLSQPYFFCMDDYRSLFPGTRADLLGLQVIPYASTGSNGLHNDARAAYLLNVLVVESKFLNLYNPAKANDSLKQTQESCQLLYNALQHNGQRFALESQRWLHFMADLLQEKCSTDSYADNFEPILALIRQGKIDILIKGVSLLFAAEEQNSAAGKKAKIKPEFSNGVVPHAVMQLRLDRKDISELLKGYSRYSQGKLCTLSKSESFANSSTIREYLKKDTRIKLPSLEEQPSEPVVSPDHQELAEPEPQEEPVVVPNHEEEDKPEVVLEPQGPELKIPASEPEEVEPEPQEEPVAAPNHEEEAKPEVELEPQSFEPEPKVPAPKPEDVAHEFKLQDYWRPDISLLARSHDNVEISTEELNKTAEIINEALQSFGVKATVADYLTGPVITRFYLALQPGVKSSAISSIETELCRPLLVSNVRVVPIIEGSLYVGLEVPNSQRKFITLGDVVSSPEFQETKAALPICLGVSVEGSPVIEDLAEAPHLLIAGTTGSGKSAGINTMLISMLLKRSPEELRLILIDPKQIEFSIYKDLPHLLTPVITDVAEKSPMALSWCVEEMERRFKLMSHLGVRNLSEYNECIRKGALAHSFKPLPWIVVVVEEYADLMAQTKYKKDKENTPESLIARLAAKSRAAGIHLVLVTQTPRAKVVTGMIKANFPSRIAFTVQNRTDSTIVLDETGAETLLGNGDMLYKFMGASSSTRAHGAFTSSEDVKAVVDAWRQKAGAPKYLADLG